MKTSADEVLAAANIKPKVSKKSKPKNKQNRNEMKRTVVTVVATLVVTGIVATAFLFTYKAGVNSERSRHSTIQAEAKNLISTVAPLK